MDINNDMSFGHSQQDFFRDAPDGVAQNVKTRLHLEVGQYFLDRSAGTPWRTRVLGNRTVNTRDIVIRARVLGTTGVNRITAYSSQVNRDLRAFSAQVTIDTIYGGTIAVLDYAPPLPSEQPVDSDVDWELIFSDDDNSGYVGSVIL